MKILFNIILLMMSFESYGAALHSDVEKGFQVAEEEDPELQGQPAGAFPELEGQPAGTFRSLANAEISFSGATPANTPRGVEDSSAVFSPPPGDSSVDPLRLQAENILINSEYTVNRELGSGGFSKVFMISKENGSQKLALKVYKAKKDSSRKAKRVLSNALKGDLLPLLFKKEGHPGIACVDSYYARKPGDSKTNFFKDFTQGEFEVCAVAMPCFNDALEFYDVIVGREGPFTLDEVLNFWGQIADALHFLHEKNIMHRDLKPENMLYEVNTGFLKLIDFGFARVLPEGGRATTQCGTAHYVAPEVLWGRDYGVAAEIWSFGVIAFVVMMRAYPFNGETPENVIESLKRFCHSRESISEFISFKRRKMPDFSRIFDRWLNVDERRRPSASELLEWVNLCKDQYREEERARRASSGCSSC